MNRPAPYNPDQWTRKQYRDPDQIGWHSGPWCIYAETDDGPCVLSSGPPHWYGPEAHESVSLAIERAKEVEALWDVAKSMP